MLVASVPPWVVVPVWVLELLLEAGLLLDVTLLSLLLEDSAPSPVVVSGWLDEVEALEAAGALEDSAGLLLDDEAGLLDDDELLSLAFMLDTRELCAAGDFGVLVGLTVLLIQL